MVRLIKYCTIFLSSVLFLSAFAYAKRTKSHDRLSDKFYNNGGLPPAVVRDKYYTYYNVATLGSGAVKDLTVDKTLNCNFAVNDCIRKICKNRKDLVENSGYVYCSSHSVDEVSRDIQNCLIDRDILEKTKYHELCQGSIVGLLYQYYDDLKVMESEFAKVSASCILAIDNLSAAEKCYFYSMGYDGDFDDSILNKLQSLCGGTVSGGSENMANQFFSAGMYGLSDVYAGSNVPVDPFSNPYKKREGWREVVQVIYDRYRKNMLSACNGNIE